MGCKAAETTCNTSNTLGPGTANECTVQQWFKKFCKGDRSLEDEVWWLATGSDQPRAIIETDHLTTIGEVAEEINIDLFTVIGHLKQIEKVKRLDKWVLHELTESEKKKKKNQTKASFWSVVFSFSTQQQWAISQLDCDVRWKVDFIQQLVTTSSVAGPRWSFKELPKAKLAPRKSHGHSLMVCCPSDPLQLSESWWNSYIWEVRSENQGDAWKTAMPAAGTDQQKGPVSSPGQYPTACPNPEAQAFTTAINKLISHWQRCIDCNGSDFDE